MDTMAAWVQSSPRAGISGWEAAPPDWVVELTGPLEGSWQTADGGYSFRLHDAGQLAIASVQVPSVISCDATALRRVTTAAYTTIAELLRSCRARYPVRLWNLIPGILDPLDDQPHRYMAFNAGRYEAYLQWFETEQRFCREVPTASGIGYPGPDLLIHCLAAELPGQPVENPRQVASYCYSKRYGSLPPCFARATRITTPDGQAEWLLVGGTASVKGEETVHSDDLRSQCAETFSNLASLVSAKVSQDEATDPAVLRQLAAYRHLRVYYVQQHDLPIISQLVESSFTGLDSLEYLQAELCRPRLLVEIEGVAELPVRPE